MLRYIIKKYNFHIKVYLKFCGSPVGLNILGLHEFYEEDMNI